MPNEHTIAENLQRLVDAKDDIAAAIEAKGVTVPLDSGLEDFASLIGSISGDIKIAPLTYFSGGSLKSYEMFLLVTPKYFYVFGSLTPNGNQSYFYFDFPEGFMDGESTSIYDSVGAAKFTQDASVTPIAATGGVSKYQGKLRVSISAAGSTQYSGSRDYAILIRERRAQQ